MPASSFDFCYQEARNNFDAMRPVPVCADANQAVGQCHQKIHISTNCYYGYHDANTFRNTQQIENDCEMSEVPEVIETPSPYCNARKRGAEEGDYPQSKRPREEVQREKCIEPETNETVKMDKNSEDLLESLLWNTHGGNMFHLIQCL